MNRHRTLAAAKLPVETNVYKRDKPININTGVKEAGGQIVG
jgi:hypothetical protein